MRTCTFASVLALLSVGCWAQADLYLPSASIDAGVIVGTATAVAGSSTGVNKYLGVPFAVSPPERFSPPQKPTPWSTPINTTAWKPACIQQFNYPEISRNFTQSVFNNPPPLESEDCLYLNVYAPAAPSAWGGRAVMFWIYGGSLEFGNAGQQYYDGSYFAAFEDVIVVTVNYRTNVFGFPSSPELPFNGHNLGFLDQRLGLDWVQRNIHAFGGDPSRVTIFGESAGAFSIDALLTSFPANSTPPFRAAILQSGQVSYRATPYTDSKPAWYALASALNCTEGQSNLTCIRAAPAGTIKSVIEHQALIFNPVADNITYVSHPAQARTSGNTTKVPILSGTNAQEGRVFVVGQNNLTAYIQSQITNSSDLIAAIEAAYPVGGWEFPTDYDAIAQIFTDVGFQCGDALFANASAAVGIPSWRYYFNASFVNTQGFPNAGVYHSSEIPIVFSTYLRIEETAQEYALTSYMRGAWARFAKDPFAGPGWNAVGTGSGYAGGAVDLDVGVLGANGTSGATIVRRADIDARCGLWNGVLTQGR